MDAILFILLVVTVLKTGAVEQTLPAPHPFVDQASCSEAMQDYETKHADQDFAIGCIPAPVKIPQGI